jgi:hypothetical protein
MLRHLERHVGAAASGQDQIEYDRPHLIFIAAAILQRVVCVPDFHTTVSGEFESPADNTRRELVVL